MTVIGVITATRAEGVRQQEVSHFSSYYSFMLFHPCWCGSLKNNSTLSHILLLLTEVTPLARLIPMTGKYCVIIF